jgi:PAS domain S-box-containing protein
MMGYNAPDLIGAHVIDFVHEDHRQAVAERMQMVVNGQEAPLMEQRFIRSDGQIVEAETIALPFNYKGIPAVQVISRDITEKKRAEATLRKNETLFTQLFNNVPMGVVLLDENGKVNQVNRGFIEMFGYELDELKGKNLNDFIVPEDLKHEGLDLNNLITSNRVVSVETIRQHRNGKQVNVILYGLPVLLDKTTLGIYGVYVEITDRKLVEEELKTRNAELDNFVYKVSHDLRAPLSSILGLVNLSRLPGNTDNPMEYINIIGEKVEQLDHFIGDVLSHSKNLKVKLTVQKVDFQDIIQKTFEDLNYLKGANEVVRTISVTGVEFFSDPWRVSEIFRNLVSNAIKYKKPDTNSVVEVRIIVDNMYADISFADNGIGIEEENLDRIFEMFYRATERSDGSGIGLYIVKNAVEKLGGQISVTSRPGEGTRFHLILPNKTNNGIARSVLEHSGLRNN